MVSRIHLPGMSGFAPLYVIESYSGYYELNTPHSHPCPTCGGYRISIDVPDITQSMEYDFECKMCHTNWKIPMQLSDIETYINAELNRIISQRELIVPEFEVRLNAERLRYQRSREHHFKMYGNMESYPYKDQYEFSKWRSRV